MVKVLEFGAIKYLPDNWKKGMPREQILNSAMRHLTAMLDGEEVDSESGLPHVGHLMCNATFLSFFEQGLGSEKAMEFYNGNTDSLKQYPVTTAAVNGEDLLGMWTNELGKPPKGYVWINLEEAKKLYKDFKAVTFHLYNGTKCYMSIKNEPMLSTYEQILLTGGIALLKKDYEYHLS